MTNQDEVIGIKITQHRDPPRCTICGSGIYPVYSGTNGLATGISLVFRGEDVKIAHDNCVGYSSGQNFVIKVAF